MHSYDAALRGGSENRDSIEGRGRTSSDVVCNVRMQVEAENVARDCPGKLCEFWAGYFTRCGPASIQHDDTVCLSPPTRMLKYSAEISNHPCFTTCLTHNCQAHSIGSAHESLDMGTLIRRVIVKAAP